MITCEHASTALVRAGSGGEVVGRICAKCHERLLIEYGCNDCDWEHSYVLGRIEPLATVLTRSCGNTEKHLHPSEDDDL